MSSQPVPLAVDDLFVELVCADDDWVRAEFDALIDGVWTDPTSGRPVRRPVFPPARAACIRRERSARQRPRATRQDGHERSPP